ncbi:MAG TPA: hypothetical protein VMS88_03465 [Terriglobales bacterium]|nr:hypothetical protein [Terriglobales bacterium]
MKERPVNGYRVLCAAALTAAALACAAIVPARAADSAADPWAGVMKRGSQWISTRAGYAKVSGDIVPNGRMGIGFGYRRFVLDKWSVGGFAHYELLGRFADAADIEVPLTFEVVRHSRWGSSVFPYVGLGGGVYYRKYYRTGADLSAFSPGRYLTFGALTPIHRRGMLGLDIRMATVDKPDWNPAFDGPPDQRPKLDDLLIALKTRAGQESTFMFNNDVSKSQTHWSVKLDYTVTY